MTFQRRNTVRLTAEQRAELDKRVLEQVATFNLGSYQGIAEELRTWLVANLPKRADPERYVDQALQRLKVAKKIKPRGDGHRGWVAR